jgi:hypothetical protein
LRRHCLQIREEIECSFPFPIEHDWLCQENSIAVDSEARFQARGLDFEFVPGPTKIGQALLIHELEARRERNADYAVLVVPSEEKVPARMHALREYNGDKNYYAVFFADPDGMKLEGMVYKAAKKTTKRAAKRPAATGR